MRRAVSFLSVLIFSMAFASQALGQKEWWRNLLPILLHGKWGFIDRTGRIVIEPKFDALGDMTYMGISHSLLVIQIGGKWGYADETGAIKIPAQFAEARDFSEGLAGVKVGHQWGFIDQTGTMVIAPQFQDVGWPYGTKGTFTEGLGRAKAQGKWGFINKSGEWIIKPRFSTVHFFSDGIARVEEGEPAQQQLAGFINKSGKYVSPPTEADYYGLHQPHAGDFSEGLSLVREGVTWGFVNTDGEIVLRGFNSVKKFSEGLAAVKVGARWGFIDKSGNNVIEVRFEDAESFSEGLAFVTETDGTRGYIDHTGKLVITLGKKKFSADQFKDGLATINSDDGSGYIDRAGKFVIKLAKGDHGEPFSGALALVHSGERGERISYVDKTGKYLFKPKLLYDPGEWSDGLIAMRDAPEGRYGYIDQTGRWVIPPKFCQAEEFYGGLAVVRLRCGYKLGYIDRTGKLVTPLQFATAKSFYFLDGIAEVSLGESPYVWIGEQGAQQKIGYIDKTGKYIWQPTN